MNKEQVKLIKETCLKDDGTGIPVAKVFTVLFNDEISFRNTDDFVIWDDENELVSVIKQNVDGVVQSAAWPFKISTGFFGNIQFLEGLYDMGSFEKVIDEMFLNKGLIDEKKKSMIMKWADNVRNHALVPKAPGPYYTTSPLIPPKPPVPEVRPDGIFHTAPIYQITKSNSIDRIVMPVIEAADPKFVETKPCVYDVVGFDMTIIAKNMKKFIEAVGDDLFYASLTDRSGDFAAIYNPEDATTISSFIENALKILPIKKRTSKYIILYIEAFGVRVKYEFNVSYENDDAWDAKWVSETTDSVLKFVKSISNPPVSSVVTNDDYNFSAVINTTDGLDIGLTNFLYALKDVDRVLWNARGRTYTMTIGDEESKTKFKKGVIDSMPTFNESETLNCKVTIMSKNDVALQYTLKVKYYNQAEAAAKVGDTYYTLLANAVANAPSGQIIEVMKDTTESIVIPKDKTLTLNLNGHTLTNVEDSDTIVNNGILTIDGNGTIDNISHKKTAITNNGKLTVLSGTISRTAEAGTASGDGNNSYYAILNHGDMTIGAEGAPNKDITVDAVGGFSSLIASGWYSSVDKTPENDTCVLTIYGGTFNGGKFCLKNDELSNTVINGGTFANSDDCTILNWHDLTINDGTFIATKPGMANINNAADGQGIGKLAINGGSFDAVAGVKNIMKNQFNPSADVVISGGKFSSDIDLSKYLAHNHVIDKDSVPGKFVVKVQTTSEVVDEEVNSFIEGLSAEGVTVEAVPDSPNTYNLTTNATSALDSMIDKVVATKDVTSVTVSDGNTSTTYDVGTGDLAAFKKSINEMMPKLNEQSEVTLTMTVNVA